MIDLVHVVKVKRRVGKLMDYDKELQTVHWLGGEVVPRPDGFPGRDRNDQRGACGRLCSTF
jgi:hypothetical protein